MKTILFLAPEHHRLDLGDGEVVRGGGTARVSNDRAEQLCKTPQIVLADEAEEPEPDPGEGDNDNSEQEE